MIAEIREKWHGPVFERMEGEGEKKGEGEKEGMRGDVVIVAHGHILRAFAQRWVGKRLEEGVGLLLDGIFIFFFFFSFLLYPSSVFPGFLLFFHPFPLFF